MNVALSRAVSRASVPISLFVLTFGIDASAHHSTGLFDGTTIATAEGRVTRFAWLSPHIYIFVQTTGTDDAAGEWRFESVPIPIMVRQGWTKDSLQVGDRVTAEGYPLRNSDEKYAWLRRVIKEDGTILDPGVIGSPATDLGAEAN